MKKEKLKSIGKFEERWIGNNHYNHNYMEGIY